MGLFFYVVMFIVACGFGWWAKGADASGVADLPISKVDSRLGGSDE